MDSTSRNRVSGLRREHHRASMEFAENYVSGFEKEWVGAGASAG